MRLPDLRHTRHLEMRIESTLAKKETGIIQFDYFD